MEIASMYSYYIKPYISQEFHLNKVENKENSDKISQCHNVSEYYYDMNQNKIYSENRVNIKV